jgi:trimeric autotransporter adhesin
MSAITTQQLSGSSSTSSSPNFLEMDEIDEQLLSSKSENIKNTANNSTPPSLKQQSSQKDGNITGNSSGFGASLSPNSPLDASDYAYATFGNASGAGNANSGSSTTSSSFSGSNSITVTPNDLASNISKINVNAPIFTSKSRQNNNTADLMNKLTLNNENSSSDSEQSAAKRNVSYDNGNDVNNNNNINNQSPTSLSPSMTLSDLKSQSKSEQAYMPNNNSYMSLPLSLGQQQLNSNNMNGDFDQFVDCMGMDKMLLQQLAANLGISLEAAVAFLAQKKQTVDPQQQILAQAIAALTAASNNTNQNGSNSNNNNIENNSQPPQRHSLTSNSSRSLLENIELLNSKFMNQKQQSNQQTDFNNSSNQNQGHGVSHQNQNQNSNYSNNLNDFSTPNITNMQIKRQSTGGFTSLTQANALFSTPMPTSSSPTGLAASNPSAFNNRLNSTPNIQYGGNGNNTNEQNRSYRSSINTNSMLANQSIHLSNDKINSMSTSNSSFNLNSSVNNGLDLSSNNQDDDEVFSNYQSQNNNNAHSNNTATSNSNNNNNNSSINQNILQNSANNTIDQITLAKLYHSFFSNPNLNSSNLSELLNNTPNMSALSLNTDMLNTNSSQNFLNLSNSSNASTLNQLKNLSNFNGNNNNNNNNNINTNNASLNQSNNNNNNNNFSNSNSNSNHNQFNLSQATLNALKQRQINGNQRSGSNSGSSNIAAITSQTSNIASLLNGGNQMQQHQQQQQFLMNDPRKQRGHSASYNSNSSQSSLFPSTSTHHVGPNATHLLQNSSLASSARLNSSTSSSAAASVLGNNSSLSHALNSLQQQQQSNGLLSSQPSHSLMNNSALSTSSNASLANQLLSASGKPLRSERLPSHVVEEIIKQAKIRRRMGGKKEVCVFCRNNGEKEQIYTSHTLKDASNHVACPILRLYQCPICHASGDQAHTIKYCPYAEKDSTCIKLFKENGRMSAAAAAFLMNSLAGGQTPPTSPPATPSPTSQSHHLSFMNQSGNSPISSPNSTSAASFSISQALNNFNSFNANYPGFNTNKSNEMNLNKTFGGSTN